MLTKDELERDRYESRLMFQRDQAAREQDLRNAQEALSKPRAELARALEAVENARREKNLSEQELKKVERETEQAKREKEQAQAEKRQAERDKIEGARQGVLARIRLCERLLNKPSTSEKSLDRLSVSELDEMAADLEKRAASPTDGRRGS